MSHDLDQGVSDITASFKEVEDLSPDYGTASNKRDTLAMATAAQVVDLTRIVTDLRGLSGLPDGVRIAIEVYRHGPPSGAAFSGSDEAWATYQKACETIRVAMNLQFDMHARMKSTPIVPIDEVGGL